MVVDHEDMSCDTNRDFLWYFCCYFSPAEKPKSCHLCVVLDVCIFMRSGCYLCPMENYLRWKAPLFAKRLLTNRGTYWTSAQVFKCVTELFDLPAEEFCVTLKLESSYAPRAQSPQICSIADLLQNLSSNNWLSCSYHDKWDSSSIKALACLSTILRRYYFAE